MYVIKNHQNKCAYQRNICCFGKFFSKKKNYYARNKSRDNSPAYGFLYASYLRILLLLIFFHTSIIHKTNKKYSQKYFAPNLGRSSGSDYRETHLLSYSKVKCLYPHFLARLASDSGSLPLPLVKSIFITIFFLIFSSSF